MLSGIRALAFSHFLQGPGGTQYLADLGADVIKVEPLAGVWERHRKPAGKVAGINATHLSLNRNKRSIAIDLKHPRAKDVIFRIVDTRNVVVENYRVGVLDRLGFGYEAIRAHKPDIIYASATGWGSSGPMRGFPGQDLLVQARTGLVRTTGGRPTAVGSPVVDHHGAALLAVGILAAYVRLLESGVGTRVESSLFSAGIDLQAEPITLWHADEADASRYKRNENLAVWYLDAPYGVYELKDCHIVISTGPNIAKLPEALQCAALMPLANADRLVERNRYAEILAAELKQWLWEDVDRVFAEHGIWYQRVIDDYDELDRDPQVAHNQVFNDYPVGDRTVRLVNHPIRYDGEVPSIRHVPWGIGQDSRAVLREAGLLDGDIDTLISEKIVGEQPANADGSQGG